MPTQKCNSECVYCYIPKEENQKEGDNEFFCKIVDKFINDLKDKNINPQLRFIGGEPYLKFDLITKLIKEFTTSFPKAMVTINTNGTLINFKTIKETLPYRKNLIHITSLDGCEEINNKRRLLKDSSNFFKRVVSSIKLLKKHDFPIYINMVLDNQTLAGLEDFIRYIKFFLKLKNLSVSLLHQSNMKKEKKLEMLRKVYKISDKYNVQIGGHHRLLLGKRIPGLKCFAGDKTILVTSDKKLAACQRFIGNGFENQPCGLDMDFTSIKSKYSPEDCCYSKDNLWLGDRLFKMYQEKYPEYLEVNSLDKILFGVIP
jgi:sulfatase maturation enzyme AslB (radical SAM superfamily)